MVIEKVQNNSVERATWNIYDPLTDDIISLPQKRVKTGLNIFPDTFDVATPPAQTPTISDAPVRTGFMDWFLKLFTGDTTEPTKTPAETTAKDRTPALPARPNIELPSPEAREQMLKLMETTRQSNRIQATTQEELREGRVYKRLVSLFKEIIQLNETLLKQSMEDNKFRNDTLDKIREATRKLKDEIHDTESKEALAKITQTGLTALAIGTTVFVIAGAAFAAATGFVPAALPAIMQAMTTTTYVVTQATTTAAQATTQATRAYLEYRRENNQSEVLKNQHQRDEVFFEFKLSREEWNQFMKLITNLWSALKEVENKRRETNRLQA